MLPPARLKDDNSSNSSRSRSKDDCCWKEAGETTISGMMSVKSSRNQQIVGEQLLGQSGSDWRLSTAESQPLSTGPKGLCRLPRPRISPGGWLSHSHGFERASQGHHVASRLPCRAWR
jgi:hypothetical protein